MYKVKGEMSMNINDNQIENELTVLRANITIETLSKYNDGTWDDLYNAELSLKQSMLEYLEMLKKMITTILRLST